MHDFVICDRHLVIAIRPLDMGQPDKLAFAPLEPVWINAQVFRGKFAAILESIKNNAVPKLSIRTNVQHGLKHMPVCGRKLNITSF